MIVRSEQALCVGLAGAVVLGSLTSSIMQRGDRDGPVVSCSVQRVADEVPGIKRFVVRWVGGVSRIVPACDCAQIIEIDYVAGAATVLIDCGSAGGFVPGVVVVGNSGSRQFVSCPCRE